MLVCMMIWVSLNESFYCQGSPFLEDFAWIKTFEFLGMWKFSSQSIYNFYPKFRGWNIYFFFFENKDETLTYIWYEDLGERNRSNVSSTVWYLLQCDLMHTVATGHTNKAGLQLKTLCLRKKKHLSHITIKGEEWSMLGMR